MKKRTNIIAKEYDGAIFTGHIVNAFYNDNMARAEIQVEFLFQDGTSLVLPTYIYEKTRSMVAGLIPALESTESIRDIVEILDLDHTTVVVDAELKIGSRGLNYCVLRSVTFLEETPETEFEIAQLKSYRARIAHLEKEISSLRKENQRLKRDPNDNGVPSRPGEKLSEMI